MFILSCAGAIGIDSIPEALPAVTSIIVKVIQFVVPVLLIIFGMLDLGKAVTAQKEDEIKKGQQTFMKRAIAAALVFFVVSIVTLIVNVLANATGEDNNSMTECLDCFIQNNGSC